MRPRLWTGVCVHTNSSYAALHMHTPKGARRVGGCSSDRRSGGDNTVWGWMVVYGLVSVSVLTHNLRERERERTRQTGRVTVSMRRLPPTIIHQMKPSTHA